MRADVHSQIHTKMNGTICSSCLFSAAKKVQNDLRFNAYRIVRVINGES
jgi:hypothetical protein